MRDSQFYTDLSIGQRISQLRSYFLSVTLCYSSSKKKKKMRYVKNDGKKGIFQILLK